jgi:hypothetical protein
MKITIEQATIEVRPGVRLTVQADGTLLFEAEALPQSQNPLVEAMQPAAPASAAKAKANGVKRPRNPAPDIAFRGDQILSTMMKTPDAWMSFHEITQRTFPDVAMRVENKPTPDYEKAQLAIKHLVRAGELHARPMGEGNRSRFLYCVNPELLAGASP